MAKRASDTQCTWHSVCGLSFTRNRACISASLPLCLPLFHPLDGAHAVRPRLELCTLRFLIAEVVLALVP